MRITEIFHSIQGESSYVGQPCVFVRLTGCPLRCAWCDTDYAFYGGRECSIDEVLSQVQDYGCRLVEVTGGEPLVQAECLPFMTRLCDAGYTVLLETSGAVDIAPVDPPRACHPGREVSGKRDGRTHALAESFSVGSQRRGEVRPG